MTLILHYKSKRDLRESIGSPLSYSETAFVDEWRVNGTVVGSNRPTLRDYPQFAVRSKGREFFAQIEIENGLIKEVK